MSVQLWLLVSDSGLAHAAYWNRNEFRSTASSDPLFTPQEPPRCQHAIGEHEIQICLRKEQPRHDAPKSSFVFVFDVFADFGPIFR